LSKYDNHYQIKAYFERTIELIDTHHPDEIAIEATLLKNVQSMLKLVARVAMAAWDCLEIFQLRSTKIKKWQLPETKMPVKEQVAKMLQTILTKRI
jgi:crossover junction endodeoxyribonuclease RuvC